MRSLNLGLGLLVVLFAASLASCPNPVGSGGSGNGSLSVKSPSWVKAEFTKDGTGTKSVKVSWENVGTSYRLYRQLGSGSWVSVGSNLSTNSFTDTSYYSGLADTNNPAAIQYAVASVSGASQSGMSGASNPTSPVVLSTKASLLVYTNKIRVTWEPHPEAETYSIYRYPNGSSQSTDPQLVASGISQSVGTLTWDDDQGSATVDPKPTIAYYYLVTWKKDGAEYGTLADGAVYKTGVYASKVDYYEGNDDWAVLPTAASQFDAANPPLIYAFDNLNGGTVKDTDWYKVVGPAGQMINVTVTLPGDTPFATGELRLQFYYNGSLGSVQSISLGASGTSFYFTPSGIGDQTVYFKIDTAVAGNQNKIGTYTVAVSNDL